jgi:hypothetical protein
VTGIISRLQYSDNEHQQWTVTPEGRATSISLTFTEFNTEECCDHVTVFTCKDPSCSEKALLQVLSGTLSPAPITFTAGVMQIAWSSNGSETRSGWAAMWAAYTGGMVSTFRDGKRCRPCEPGFVHQETTMLFVFKASWLVCRLSSGSVWQVRRSVLPAALGHLQNMKVRGELAVMQGREAHHCKPHTQPKLRAGPEAEPCTAP